MSGIHITEVLEILYFRAFTMPWTQTREYPHVFAVPDHNMGSGYNYMRWRKKTLGLKLTSYEKLESHKVPFLNKFSPTIVPSPLDWFEWVHITGYWFLDKEKTSDDQDGDKSVICSEEGVRDAESSVDWPIKLIGEEIRLDFEYTKSLIKQHAQTSSQVMVNNLNASPVWSTMVMTTSDFCRGRSNSDNLRPNSSSTQLLPNLSQSGSTGFLSGKTKPKMEGLVPTQRPVKTGDPPPSTTPALITTDTKV
ncbi:hypothetical protein BY996DRAFT_6416206 [Phakopsora pachyrhizi]|nr:hypothetical protein BY996DRAFT_6416206 [Phakopsora pachyrhizi]